MEIGREVDGSHSIDDESFEMIKALNKGFDDNTCPRERIFDTMVSQNILYKNVIGSFFLLNQSYAAIISDETRKEISNWVGAVDSFHKNFASDIAKYKAVCQRDMEDGRKLFKIIESSFYSKCHKDVFRVGLLPLSQLFDVKIIDQKEAQSIMDRIYHGVPISEPRNKNKETRSLIDFLKGEYF